MLILEIEFRAWHRNHSTSGLSGEWLKVTTKGQEESKENFFLLFFFFFFFFLFFFFWPPGGIWSSLAMDQVQALAAT